jgi:hypothetical protein
MMKLFLVMQWVRPRHPLRGSDPEDRRFRCHNDVPVHSFLVGAGGLANPPIRMSEQIHFRRSRSPPGTASRLRNLDETNISFCRHGISTCESRGQASGSSSRAMRTMRWRCDVSPPRICLVCSRKSGQYSAISEDLLSLLCNASAIQTNHFAFSSLILWLSLNLQ